MCIRDSVKAEHEKARKILSENREKLDELAMYLYAVSYTHLDVYKRQAGQHTCAWLAFDFQYIDCRADHFLYQCKITGTNYQTW